MKIKLLLKQIRIAQWSKNLIIFLPVLANHQLNDIGVMKNAFIGFLSFSLIASSVYVLNDIIDVESDRAHPNKKNRPIASGKLSITNAYIILIVCFILGELLALNISRSFLFITVLYITLNLIDGI